MMNTVYKRLSVIATGFMILALTITGCTSQASNIGLAREKDQNTIGTDFVVAEVGSYDSADTAVVVSVDLESGYVTFLNIATGRQYTLSYDGTTYVKDRYEGPMAMSQIREGDIVDITFLKSKKRLASVQLSPDSWVFDNIENYDLNGMNKTATIGSNTYSLPDEAVFLSEGRQAELMEIVNKDVLTVSGIDHTIYSVNVQRGHGYLRLSNEQALVGGWIEVGNTIAQKITEDMLLAVPEGSYQVVLSNDNASCVKEVVIERNKEVVLDASDLEIVQDKTGKILITVNPSTATVKVDGEIIDTSDEIELTYGIHQIRLEAEGYQNMTKYIQVGSEYASINFTMEEGETEDEDENSVSDNSSVDDIANAVTGNRVYVDAPQGVEAYLDGNYVGITPISFTKVTGDHTITLSKSGYQSKSYTIYLYDDGEDITYSFADLEANDSTTSGSRRVTSSSRRSTSSPTSTSATSSTSSGQNQGNNNNSDNSNNTVSGNVIIIKTIPDGVTVHLDDELLGITPLIFPKIERRWGRHTITLEKEGYQSINETIFFDDDGRDDERTFVLKEEAKEPNENKNLTNEEKMDKLIPSWNDSSLTIKKGESQTLSISTSASDEVFDYSVVWSSNDENVAIVEDGLVTGVEVGDTKITATVKVGDIYRDFSCDVKIEEGEETGPQDDPNPQDPTDKEKLNELNPELGDKILTLGINDSQTLSISTSADYSYSVEWKSDNESVAKVTEDGGVATVTGVGIGETTITAIVCVGGESKDLECSVIVKEKKTEE